MKKIVLLSTVLLGAWPSAHAQLTLNPGGSFTYEFSSLPLTGIIPQPTTAVPSGFVAVSVNPSTFQAGELLRVEMFEGTAAGPVINSRDVDPTSLNFVSTIGAWQDLGGAVRFTMVSGSAALDSFLLQAFTIADMNQNINQYSLTVTPVPEPSALALLGIVAFAAGLSGLLRKRGNSAA